MYCVKSITDDMYYVGASDRRISLFENVFPLENGISYNSYLVLDEKNILLDTVDKSVSGVFFENLAHLLKGKRLDYVVINHMEPDHCATLGELILNYPEVKIVSNAKAVAMMKQFFDFDVDNRSIVIKEGDTLNTGKHTFAFLMAPMVHWPETMVTYDETDKILYSADAFGSFGALSGNIFADEVNYDRDWIDESRRYYTNIVGKYGTQVQTLLKKAESIEISMICPLHGHIWRQNINYILNKYALWSSYQPEEKAVMIAYASIYGNTENAVNILASKLADSGITNIVMYDVSKTHPSVIVSEAFRCSHIVFASTTYNAGIFCNMETVLHDIKAHNLQNRTVAVIENGTWASTSGKLIREILSSMKNITILEESAKLASAVKSETVEQLSAIADAITKDFVNEEKPKTESSVNPQAMFKLSYGLFVLSANENGKDNGCIINTVTQVTDNPKRVSIAVNKANLTCEMIDRTGKFTVSVLSTDAPFSLFEHFGFVSGRDKDKFADYENKARTENGTLYITDHANAYISCTVRETVDCGTHLLFIADVTDAEVLSEAPSVTYAYYFANIKPKPVNTGEKKKGFVCKICGYVYEGEELPPDFVCPLCKHGAEDFEPIK